MWGKCVSPQRKDGITWGKYIKEIKGLRVYPTLPWGKLVNDINDLDHFPHNLGAALKIELSPHVKIALK